MVWFCVAMLPTVGPKVVGISFLGQHALSMIETCIKHRSLFLAVRLWYPLTLWKSCIVGSSGVFPWFLFRILEIIVMRFCWWNLPRAGNLYISALKTKSDPFNAHICMCIYIYIQSIPVYHDISPWIRWSTSPYYQRILLLKIIPILSPGETTQRGWALDHEWSWSWHRFLLVFIVTHVH